MSSNPHRKTKDVTGLYYHGCQPERSNRYRQLALILHFPVYPLYAIHRQW